MHAEQEVAPVLRRADAEEEAGIVLLMDQRVCAVRADGVAEQLARTVLVVDPDIEEALAVVRPFERAVIVGDARIDQLRRSPPR